MELINRRRVTAEKAAKGELALESWRCEAPNRPDYSDGADIRQSGLGGSGSRQEEFPRD